MAFGLTIKLRRRFSGKDVGQLYGGQQAINEMRRLIDWLIPMLSGIIDPIDWRQGRPGWGDYAVGLKELVNHNGGFSSWFRQEVKIALYQQPYHVALRKIGDGEDSKYRLALYARREDNVLITADQLPLDDLFELHANLHGLLNWAEEVWPGVKKQLQPFLEAYRMKQSL